MFLVSKAYGSAKKVPEDFGFRHLRYKFQNDPVDVIIISKHNESRIAKPLFFYCQGNLPKPLIGYDAKGLYDLFPFDENKFLDGCHIAVVGQPFIPLITSVARLAENQFTAKTFLQRNYLDYYAYRNHFILKQLVKERWACDKKIVVCGHEDGSAVATKLASMNRKVTHLIYSNGNPYGKIMDVIAQSRIGNSDVFGKNQVFYNWKRIVEIDGQIIAEDKTTYSFSIPQNDMLMAMNIPVLLTYNDQLPSVAYHDLLRVESIRQRKKQLTFLSFDGNSIDAISQSWLEWISLNACE